MDETEKRAVELVKAGKDAAKLLEFVEAAFDQMALAIDPGIILAFDLGTLVRRNDGFTAPFLQEGDERRARVAAIRQHFREGQAVKQRLGLGTVMALARCQDHPERIA